MDREELAWAAGFFDGEGYVGAKVYWVKSRGRNKYFANLSISQVDRRVLDRFQRVVGVGTVLGPYLSENARRHGWSPQWNYAVHGFEKVQAVVAMLWFKLSPVKRTQAAKALSAWRGI